MPALLPAITKLIGGLLTFAAVLLLAGTIVLLAGPRLLGWEGVVVLSGSMEPALKTGGVAFIAPLENAADATRLRVGEIITFTSPQRGDDNVTHRIVEVVPSVSGPLYRTQGDANPVPDQDLVAPEAVAATLKHHVPHLGRLIYKLRDPFWFYLFIGIPAALVVLGELLNISRQVSGAEDRRSARRQRDGRGASALLVTTPKPTAGLLDNGRGRVT